MDKPKRYKRVNNCIVSHKDGGLYFCSDIDPLLDALEKHWDNKCDECGGMMFGYSWCSECDDDIMSKPEIGLGKENERLRDALAVAEEALEHEVSVCRSPNKSCDSCKCIGNCVKYRGLSAIRKRDKGGKK
jgi:hypothetical protein